MERAKVAAVETAKNAGSMRNKLGVLLIILKIILR
jgi:3-hydroxyacyl-CoA dehydrogenase